MSRDRAEGRRAGNSRRRRMCRPTLEGVPLETRVVLSHLNVRNFYLLTHPEPGNAKKFNNPPALSAGAHRINDGPVYTKGQVAVETARGGSAVLVATTDGSHFRISVTLADTQFDGGLSGATGGSGTGVVPSARLQPSGTVRAYPMNGGKVGLIVDGTTDNMQLTIEPIAFPQRKSYAHSFSYGQTQRSHVLNIGSINVTSGHLNAVLGYHSADLSGPLTIGSQGLVDRIAFNNLLPGAAIGVGGTLNTLDVLNDINLTSGPGINVGRDLNLLNVGGNVTFANGASLIVNRFVGLNPQPPKGTAPGSNFLALNQSQTSAGTSTLVPGLSADISGNFTLGGNSVLFIKNGISNSSVLGSTSTAPAIFLINGSLNAESTSQIQIPNLVAGTTFTRTVTVANPTPPPATITVTQFNNLVARTGINIPGV